MHLLHKRTGQVFSIINLSVIIIQVPCTIVQGTCAIVHIWALGITMNAVYNFVLSLYIAISELQLCVSLVII
jgi:hypothetical protein